MIVVIVSIVNDQVNFAIPAFTYSKAAVAIFQYRYFVLSSLERGQGFMSHESTNPIYNGTLVI